MLSDLGTSSQEISATKKLYFELYFSSVQKLSRVLLFVTTWTAPHQASVSITNSWCLLKFISIELVMPSNHLILCRPILLPSNFSSIRVFFSPMSQFCASAGQSIGVSASSCFQWISGMISFRVDWFDLLAVQGTLVFSNTTVKKHQFFSAQLSL